MVSLRHLILEALALPLAVQLSSAFSIGRDDAISSPNHLWRSTHGLGGLSRLWAREDDEDNPPCDKPCAPRLNSEGNRGAKRSLQEFELWVRNVTLEERMKLPAGDMDAFMVEEMPEAISVGWDTPEGGDMNTAVSLAYEDPGPPGQPPVSVEFSVGTGGLCGCTSLWIISRKGVYGTHYWESISFSPDDIWRRVKSETNSALFKRTIIDGIKNGYSEGPTEYQAQLRAQDIQDGHERAYLVHPEMSCGKRFKMDGYRRQWNKIKMAVGEVIPSLMEDFDIPPVNSRWTEIVYNRLDREDPRILKTSRGHVLFKFDPEHKDDPEQTEPGKKKATLWVEGNEQPYHDDTW